jgi:hypothetical protein
VFLKSEAIAVTTILKLPVTELQEMIQVHLVEPLDLDWVVRILVFALDNRLSTTGISEILAKHPSCGKPSYGSLGAFVQWCAANDFRIITHDVQTDSPGLDGGPPNPLSEKFFQEARKIGEAIASGNEFGRSHKYWFFRPAWEVDSALWSEIFGEDDPALVIAHYASSFFKTSVSNPTPRVITLSPSDVFVFDWVIQNAAKVICSGKGSKSETWVSMFRGAIATACRLENILHCAIKWTSADFLRAITETPDWLAPHLLNYWAERIDFASELPKADADCTNNLIHQAEFIACCLLKHIAPHFDASCTPVPTFSFISDRTIVSARDSIECIEIEADANVLKPLLRSLTVAIYEARDPFFGGIFPFTFHEAKDIIGSLVHETGYWLADFTYYDAEVYEEDFDDFGLFSRNVVNYADGSIRRNWHAQRRYESYKDAYLSMEREGLSELACAWWAFFIASQVLAFPGFGLAGGELKDVTNHTASLMKDRCVAKAVRFAVAQEQDRLPSLASRISLALLQKMISEPTETSSPQIVHLGLSDAQIEVYLRERIEPNIWSGLTEQSRQDLIEAEQLWVRAAPEFGAGRSDWGALVAIYSRPIEAEVRSHLGPLLERLGRAGLCTVKDLTLGGCVQGIREAKKALRTGHYPNVSDVDKARIAELHQFFVSQDGFIESFRNRANHGNRENPITPQEFLRWRTAIFEDRLFALTLSS